MNLFKRVVSKRVAEGEPEPLKAQAKATGVPLPILKKVFARGVADAPEADKSAAGQARVASFVRGGVDRKKDHDLWNKYQGGPEAKTEDAERGADGKITAGIFIPLPDVQARYYPKKLEDDSAPHITMLYVGDLTPDEMTKLVEAVRRCAAAWPPFRVDVARYAEFVNKEGQTIAHMVPEARISLVGPDGERHERTLADLHADLAAAVEDAGIPMGHSYGGEPTTDYHERIAAFKSHATLDYMPPGERYAGPKPTGSWQVTEIEVWGYEKYRVPLGATPYMTPAPGNGLRHEDVEVVAEVVAVEGARTLPEQRAYAIAAGLIKPATFALAPAIPLLALSVSAPAPAPAPVPVVPVVPVVEDKNKALIDRLARLLSDRTPVVPVRAPEPAAVELAVVELPLTTPLVVESATAESTIVAPAPDLEPIVTVAEPVSETVTTAALPSAATAWVKAQVEEAAPPVQAQVVRPWRPMKAFEAFGHLEGSILDFGGTEEHDYARYDLRTEDHAGIMNRRWKTVVCGSLGEQTATERVSTLLAVRGLLRRDGKALIALRPGQVVEDWLPLLKRFFAVKPLSVKGADAWQLTPTTEFSEQTQPPALEQPSFQAPAPVATPVQPQLPPISIGPLYFDVPERQVQVTAPVHITTAPVNITMPKQQAPEVTFAEGAVQVTNQHQIDVHPPAQANKKRVVMTKDAYGKVTGELEIVPEKTVQHPEFPETMDDIIAADDAMPDVMSDEAR